jgi:nitrate/nitrite transporter NarK
MAWGTLINCIYIPGAFIGGLLSDRIGRRRTMALGFSLQAILGFILGGALGPIQTKLPLFIVLYGICLTLGEVGPGAMALVLPLSLQPARASPRLCVATELVWQPLGAKPVLLLGRRYSSLF